MYTAATIKARTCPARNQQRKKQTKLATVRVVSPTATAPVATKRALTRGTSSRSSSSARPLFTSCSSSDWSSWSTSRTYKMTKTMKTKTRITGAMTRKYNLLKRSRPTCSQILWAKTKNLAGRSLSSKIWESSRNSKWPSKSWRSARARTPSWWKKSKRRSKTSTSQRS